MLLPLFLLTAGLLQADEAAPAPTPADPAPIEKPVIKDLGDGKFSVGEVTFNQKDRNISFPGRLNMIEGLLEFAIVHQNGKIHESLLVTDASPFHINVALKLLRYKPSEELFPILDEDWRPTKEFPEVSEEVKAAARVEILITWKKEDGSKGEAALNDWIYHSTLERPIQASPWIYGGSYVHNGSFQAQSTGDVSAIFTANSALFNYPGKDRELDTVWIPTPDRLPAVDTPVTIIIKPVLTKTTP